MPPPLSTRTSTAAGPVRRALPARPGGVIAPTQATGAGSDHQSVFERALSEVTAWRDSAKQNPAFHAGMEGPALQAMETAQGGLDAWQALPVRVRKATMESRNSLLNRRADAAVVWLLAMTGQGLLGMAVEQLAGVRGVAASRTRCAAHLEQLGQNLKRI
jgi:hypothetical protein